MRRANNELELRKVRKKMKLIGITPPIGDRGEIVRGASVSTGCCEMGAKGAHDASIATEEPSP